MWFRSHGVRGPPVRTGRTSSVLPFLKWCAQHQGVFNLTQGLVWGHDLESRTWRLSRSLLKWENFTGRRKGEKDILERGEKIPGCLEGKRVHILEKQQKLSEQVREVRFSCKMAAARWCSWCFRCWWEGAGREGEAKCAGLEGLVHGLERWKAVVSRRD